MYQDVFHSIEKCLDNELWTSLNDAERIGILTPEKSSYYWFYRKEGMRWLNEFPDWVEPSDEDIYTEREENYNTED